MDGVQGYCSAGAEHVWVVIDNDVEDRWLQTDDCYLYGRYLAPRRTMGFSILVDAAGNRRWRSSLATSSELESRRQDRRDQSKTVSAIYLKGQTSNTRRLKDKETDCKNHNFT